MKKSIDKNLPRLAGQEKEFVSLVKQGLIDEVERFLEQYSDLDVNSQSYNGYTALTFAVKAEDIPMAQLLLRDQRVVMGDAVLHAVQTGNKVLVAALLDERVDETYSTHGHQSADFSPDMTPLILAAHMEHYDIIRLLLKRGHTIEKVHPPNCFCYEKCQAKIQGEQLDASLARINCFKALTSPAYICQTSLDPVLTAFTLSKELRSIADIEREFKDVYLEMAEQCSRLTVDFLTLCRTNTEIELLLERKEGNARVNNHPHWRFSRVGLAVELEEKDFVAHNHTQQVLRNAWLEGWQDWKRLNFVAKLSRLLPRIFLLPLMSIIYLVIPKTRYVRTWRTPLSKFLAFASSYIIFLGMILAQNHLDSYKTGRGPPKTGFEVPIAFYVLGMTWRLLKLLWLYGFRWYLRQKWSIYDVTMVLLFDAALACWVWSTLDVKWNGNATLPRNDWDQYDPTIIAELLYAIAITFAFGKLLYFFQIGQSLGPLLTSLSRMFTDIAVFMALFFVIMFAFTIGMFQIYHHYTGNARIVDGTEVKQVQAFDTIHRSFITLYWAIYGYTPPNYADVIVPDRSVVVDGAKISIPNEHRLTELVGHSLYVIYYVAGVIILINLLIAMMSTSYSNVECNRDVEWKFARTKVWMIFFQHGSTLPPPFNMVPSPKMLVKNVMWLTGKINNRKTNKCTLGRCCYDEIEDKLYAEDDIAYELIMTRLVQRYLTSRQNGGVTDFTSAGTFSNIFIGRRSSHKTGGLFEPDSLTQILRDASRPSMRSHPNHGFQSLSYGHNISDTCEHKRLIGVDRASQTLEHTGVNMFDPDEEPGSRQRRPTHDQGGHYYEGEDAREGSYKVWERSNERLNDRSRSRSNRQSRTNSEPRYLDGSSHEHNLHDEWAGSRGRSREGRSRSGKDSERSREGMHRRSTRFDPDEIEPHRSSRNSRLH